MRMELTGGDCRYPMEQLLQTLFPEESHRWDGKEADCARVRISAGAKYVTASARITRDGRESRGQSRALLPQNDYDRERLTRYTLQRAVYTAALAFLPEPPAWGALSGVRPAKLGRKLILELGSEKAAEKLLVQRNFLHPDKAKLTVSCAREALRVLQSRKPGEIDVYVGIPFCPTRCSYCSFVSAATGKQGALLEPYTEALCREILHGGDLLRELGCTVRTVYVGGGTPTTLNPSQLDRLCAAIRSLPLAERIEWTVEAGRPDTITHEKLAVLRQYAVERISINPQSMTDAVLRAVGRPHTAADIERAMAMAKDFPAVNMDLIAGLPLETPESFARSLDRVIGLAPANITVHTLALKRGTDFHADGHALTPAQEIAAMLAYSSHALQMDYAPYYLYRQKYIGGSFENIGWTKPGAACDYNIAMMEETGSVFAFGAGAVTKLVEGARVRRVQNPKYAGEYLHSAGLPEENRARILAALRELTETQEKA